MDMDQQRSYTASPAMALTLMFFLPCALSLPFLQVSVPYQRLMSVPAGMSHPEASSLLMAYGTSYHALVDRGSLKAGDNLLVLGASGGVGLAAVQIAKAFGAKVYAAASSPEKLALCKDEGAE